MPYITTCATSLLLAYRTQLLSSLTCYLYTELSINFSTLKDILPLLYRETAPLYYIPLALPFPPLFLFICYL